MNWKPFFINGISVFLGLIFFTSGMAKVYFEHRFPGLIGPVWLEEQLQQYDLGMFARFIAFSQITIGFILLTLRYRTLGAIMLLPMVLSILLVTISLNWAGTPYVLSFFLLLNMIVVAADGRKLVHLVGIPLPHKMIYRHSPSPLKSGLIWLAGYLQILASIYLSSLNLPFAYLVCISGIMIALYPYFKDGRAASTIANKSKIVLEHQVA